VQKTEKFSPNAGIAIGPILFVLAILALLAMVMASGNGDYQVASGADRITADIVAQANMIRSTINNCNMQYMMGVSTGTYANVSDAYPSPSGVTAVSALTCTPTGNSSLWGAILLPPATQGFQAWNYIDDSTNGGGRCIWTQPNPTSTSASIVAGLTRAAAKFNSATSYSSSSEVLYNPGSSYQKFVVWITLPTGTLNTHCDPATNN